MNWNPEKKPYCKGCPHYQCIGNYIYELERDPKMRLCRHTSRCKWVHDKTVSAQQVRLFEKEG